MKKLFRLIVLVLAVAETHDLDEAIARLPLRPVGAGLLVTFELIASKLGQSVAKAREQAGVLGALFLGDDIAVGLQKHEIISAPRSGGER